MSTENEQLEFPQDFLWGAATSAHQVEGNTHNQWTVWELENASDLADKARHELTWVPHWEQRVKILATDPDNYVSAAATDHFNRYESDFDIMSSLNMNAYRFSIEWSRIEPTDGAWDVSAIAHYRNYVKVLRARGIEPMMTLMHWTLPTWFTDKGGFEKRRNVNYFVRFAEKVLEELGSEVRYICTINEPEIYTIESYLMGSWPPNKKSPLYAARVYLNLASAHNKIAKLAHKMNREFSVGLSKNCAHHYMGDDAWLSRLNAAISIWGSDYFFLNRTKNNLDWLGLNYYFSDRHYGFKIHNPENNLSDLGWAMEPANIQFVIERLHKKYKLPIIVTENGVADAEDEHRQWWISQTVTGIFKAMQNGAQVRGYLHWSLLDNFEWAMGKWPRFGLVRIDYKTLERTPRHSAVWFGKFIKKMRGLS